MREDLTSRFSIKDGGCMHPDDKQTTHCVDDDMSLPALDKLATVEAGLDRCLRCPSDALAINDGAAWLRTSTELWSILVYDLDACSFQAASRCSSGGLSVTGIPSL